MNKKVCFKIDKTKDDEGMSLKNFKEELDKFTTNKQEELTIFFKDPLTQPNTLDMIRYAEEKGIKTILYTSGISYDKEIIEYYEMELKKALDKIDDKEKNRNLIKQETISYYQDLMEKNANYKEINIEKLKKLYNCGLDKVVFDIKEYEEDTKGRLSEIKRQLLIQSIMQASFLGTLEVNVNFVLTKNNCQEMIKILKMLRVLSIDNINVLSKDLTAEEIEEFKLTETNILFNANTNISVNKVEKDKNKQFHK